MTTSATTSPQPASATLRRSDLLLAGVLAVLVWVGSFRFPDSSAAPILDPSFMQALGVALVQRMQFGVDIVYTYGPLGWFNAKPHQPELDWIAIVGWELGLKLVVALFLAAAALRLRSRFALLGFAIALVVPDMGHDAWAFLAIVATSAWAIRNAERRWTVLLVPFALLVALALVKFTYTLLVLVAVVCIALAAGRRARSATVLAVFAVMFVAAWSALGQSPANLPAWLASSLSLASAYSTAQSVAPSALMLGAALLLMALCLVTWGISVRGARELSPSARRTQHLVAAVWLAGFLVAYKSGFTRSSGNEICFFGFAGAAVFLIPEPLSVARRGRIVFSVTRALACAAALAAFSAVAEDQGRDAVEVVRACGRRLGNNLRTVTHLGAHERMRAEERVGLARKYSLPRTRARVGDATIDVFAAEQGFVFLNDLEWHPRPVFQSFAAMTDELSLANARFLAGPDGPRFVLFLPTTIDVRLEGMEDARTLEEMLRGYVPVVRERGMLLFERRADPPRAGPREIVLEREIRPGETLDLSGIDGQVLELELDAHLDLSGRVRALLLGAPKLEMEIEANDGIRETVRIVPAMLASGVIVRPWLKSTGDWVRFLVGDPVHAISRLRFVDEGRGWSAPFVVRVRRCDELVPRVDEATRTGLRWSMFSPAPSRFESPLGPDPTILRGYLDALVVQSPSVLSWTLSPGAYRLHAQFGFLPNAWREGPTDGAIVRVEVRGADGSRKVLYERVLDPKHVPLDGVLKSLDVEVPLKVGDEVELITDPGPAGDTERDLIFWTNVAFTPMQ